MDDKAQMTVATTDRIYAILQTAAADGLRCPTNKAIAEQLRSAGVEVSAGTVPGYVSQLARGGRVVVRVYGHNWREVEICDGRHKGKLTLRPPDAGEPWKVIG